MKNTYTTEEIKAVSAKLRALPAIDKHKREHTKQETIEKRGKEIQTLRQRGYTYEQIGTALRDAGIEITTSTLKSYLERARAKAEAAAAPPSVAMAPAPPPASTPAAASTPAETAAGTDGIPSAPHA